MLLTILYDQYKKSEKYEIVSALDDLCSPNDSYGWSSAGLYCYWDPRNSEPLYLGLAQDLTERFKQHNGLIGHTGKGNKREQINSFFEKSDQIGFSVFLQSSLDQPNLAASRTDRMSLPGNEGLNSVQINEGLLLMAFKNATGKLPKWNKIGGSVSGAMKALPNHFSYYRDLTDLSYESVFRSPYTIRSLAKEAQITEVTVETYLHMLRLFTVGEMGTDVDSALKIITIGPSCNIIEDCLNKSDRAQKWIERMRILKGKTK